MQRRGAFAGVVWRVRREKDSLARGLRGTQGIREVWDGDGSRLFVEQITLGSGMTCLNLFQISTGKATDCARKDSFIYIQVTIQ